MYALIQKETNQFSGYTTDETDNENHYTVEEFPENYQSVYFIGAIYNPKTKTYTEEMKPEPEQSPVNIVPQRVSKFQAKAALYNNSLLQTVLDIINHPDTQMLMKLAWEDAQYFERNSPTIISLAEQLELTEEQVDDLFIEASEIKA